MIILELMRWLLVLMHTALLLFCGWEIGTMLVEGQPFGLGCFLMCFAINASGLRKALED